MGTGIEQIKSLSEINKKVHESAKEYYHTRPVVSSNGSFILPGETKHPFSIHYDIKDLFTIGAVTHNSVLMTGGTDVGKTTLAKMVMNALFGAEDKGWHRIDVDTDFGKDTYSDVDFSTLAGGKKMSEGLYDIQPYLRLPGLILDEINRGHPQLVNKLLHFFDKDVSLPDGSRRKIGHENKDGSTYQFQIAAINEGADYSGTFSIDKALRRRTVIEIPMDIFPATPSDRLKIQKNGVKESPKNKENNLEAILKLNRDAASLGIHPLGEMYISFLEAFDYCKNSITGEKGSVDSRNGSILHVCTNPATLNGEKSDVEVGCEFLRAFPNSMCPYVRGITPGISKNLLSTARGFALIRATKVAEMLAGHLDAETRGESYSIKQAETLTESLQKYTKSKTKGTELARLALKRYCETLEVEKEDIESALGFVGYSKIGMAPQWVQKHYQGNKHAAISFFAGKAEEKFAEAMKVHGTETFRKILEGNGSREEISKIMDYCKNKNPWMWRVLAPYLESKKPAEKQDSVNALYE